MIDLPHDLIDRVAGLPKIDLHRHLEGSVRVETLVDVARQEGLDLPLNTATLAPLVQVQERDPKEAGHFLTKFNLLREFFRSPEIIRRVTYEAIEDAAADNVVYLELRFTPMALAHTGGFDLEDVSQWVLEASTEAAKVLSIQVGLIASANCHEAISIAERVVQIASDLQSQGIVGVDLAGDEMEFTATTFEPIYTSAKEAGLGVTIHAGEWTGAERVRHAIEVMGADRIGHGVRVIENADVVALAMERETTFEVSLTSNLLTGVVDKLSDHPLQEMLKRGLRVTLNTDDPCVFNTTLTNEFILAIREQGLSLESLRGLILGASQAAFQKTKMKKGLEKALLEAFFVRSKNNETPV